jgi:hypothetical protein
LPEQKNCPDPALKLKKNRIVRALLIVAGTISLAFAIIGIAMPVLPTTPFLLLTVACYCRSSERLYNWLINNKWFGEYIRNYQEGRGIPLKTKIFALAVLWTTISVATFVILPMYKLPLPNWTLQIAMFVIAIGVSIHILRLPTYKKNLEQTKEF